MNPEDKDGFKSIVLETARIKREDIRHETLDLWFEELSEFRLEAVRYAYIECRRTESFFPDIACIFRCAREWEEQHPAYSREFLNDQARIQKIGIEEREKFNKLIGVKRLRGESRQPETGDNSDSVSEPNAEATE